MFEVGIVTHFEAAHSLRGNFGPAQRQHGHTYQVEVIVSGNELHDDGTLLDMSRLEHVVQEATNVLHYRNLNDIPAFEGQNTTAEIVARFFFEQTAPHLADMGLSKIAIRVWESPRGFAGFESSL